MKNKKTYLGMILGLLWVLLTFVLAGCGGTASKSNAPQNNPDERPVIKARLGTIHPAEGAVTNAIRSFANSVSEKTNGKLIIEVYPAQQLGNPRELIESTQSGIIEGVFSASGFFVGFNPVMAIPQLPYLFPSREATYDVLIKGEGGRVILDSLEKQNLKGINFWPAGFKQFTSNKPIRTPEDFRGTKIRVMESPILMAQFRALGATPIPINFAELYSALQQGVVDGQENPLVGIFDAKLYEVQKYMTLSDHGFMDITLAFNKNWFERLPAEYQQAITSAAIEQAMEFAKSIENTEANVMIPAIKSAGVEVIEITPEQKALFAQTAGPAAEKALRDMLDPSGIAILDKVIKLVKEHK
jgi:C4-dicarboxylate-binding protein DctP